MPTKNHSQQALTVEVRDNNNLTQKNISIVGTDAGTDFAVATVTGSLDNPAERLYVEINRGRLPREVQLYVDLMDPLLRRRLKEFDAESQSTTASLDSTSIRSEPRIAAVTSATLAAGLERRLVGLWSLQRKRPSWYVEWYVGREVVFLRAQHRVQVPICMGRGHLTPLIIGGIVAEDAEPGEYQIVLAQRQPSGEISGSATLALTIGRRSELPQG